jgi:hypothetical protein
MESDKPPALVVAFDTSAVEAAAFDFRGQLLRSVVNACVDGRITLLVTRLTSMEVEHRIQERAKEAAELMRKAYFLKHVRHVDFLGMQALLSTAAVTTDIVEQWREFLAEARAEVLDVDHIDAAVLFEQFLKREPPFSQKKPHEWRDAVVVARLRSFAETNGTAVNVCSRDNDFQGCCDGVRLVHAGDIQSVLESANSRVAIASAAKECLTVETSRLKEMIGEHYEGMLFSVDDDSDAETAEIEIGSVDDMAFRVIDVREGAASIAVDCTLTFSAFAELPDYGSSPVDCGEYVMLFKDTVRIHATRRASFVVRVTVDPEDRDDCEIVELELVGDPYVVLDSEEDDFEVIKHWEDDHSD